MATFHALCRHAEISGRSNHHFFELIHVPTYIAPVRRKIKNRITDKLAGAVVRNVAAAVSGLKFHIHLREHSFSTVVGTVKFGAKGEWAQSRVLQVQYQTIKEHDIDQFTDMSTQVVVAPAEYASGEVIYPYERAK